MKVLSLQSVWMQAVEEHARNNLPRLEERSALRVLSLQCLWLQAVEEHALNNLPRLDRSHSHASAESTVRAAAGCRGACLNKLHHLTGPTDVQVLTLLCVRLQAGEERALDKLRHLIDLLHCRC